MIAGCKNTGRLTTLLILALLLLSFLAIIVWTRKKKSPDPKPSLHTQTILSPLPIPCNSVSTQPV